MADNEGESRLSAATSMAATAAVSSSTSSLQAQALLPHSTNSFFVWREFLWGALAGGFGEGTMHPIDTVKTRIQSQAILSGSQHQKTVLQMIRTVWAADGLRGFYRGVAPGLTGSLATGATYFGFIESTKKWIEESHPSLGGHWAHFLAGGMGDTLGSFIYVPCEVIKQRMQVQGTSDSWSAVISKSQSGKIPGVKMYGYYNGMFHAGRSIWKEQGRKGLYAGYWSTLARDVPFAGLMVMFYEALKDLTDYGMKKWTLDADYQINTTLEGLVLGGVAGGLSAYVTTPLDVIKTRLQVQGPDLRYKGWFHAIHRTWMIEGAKGAFRGSIPRVIWYVPASALTFMAVEFLREKFSRRLENEQEEVASISIDKKRIFK
ncbi:hypothetical protein BVRB_5g123500 [Beta vulgaris subsp. vulgaris]|uniref:uncharacterized protein LOC104907886 isoform X1 n=2 Tax=Beta vulgaris subsp. vulgaris TaxID=3555 RepID=UPI00053F84B7|nr:uncharacterized protein LOC104907886 isoform X1 [Beta vulgaris subsp. vulgaris]KMS97786.1 hypothetical protein BVRB_5g123500 [Beta vulgaris subsp. vulgaris]